MDQMPRVPEKLVSVSGQAQRAKGRLFLGFCHGRAPQLFVVLAKLANVVVLR